MRWLPMKWRPTRWNLLWMGIKNGTEAAEGVVVEFRRISALMDVRLGAHRRLRPISHALRRQSRPQRRSRVVKGRAYPQLTCLIVGRRLGSRTVRGRFGSAPPDVRWPAWQGIGHPSVALGRLQCTRRCLG